MNSSFDYRNALTRGWWMILLCLGGGLAIAALLTSRQTPVYRSSGMLVVTPSSETSEAGEIIRSLETLERRTVVATFARVAETRETREAVAALLKIDSGRLRGYRINGSVLPNTNIIRIVAEGRDAELTAGVANAAGEVTAQISRDLYRVYSMRWMARAQTPRSPASPDPQRNYLVGGVVGLVLGLAGALALERMRGPRPEHAG
ncbi:MAG TPA: Wzz/FepE/Etk N-terminal domain-containing protein [Thermoanaerobaculia bacterium]|nr:Wzz/FepE/Etk N-terminal domain-containing protein [Thermoanaerobaculia bacterium]